MTRMVRSNLKSQQATEAERVRQIQTEETGHGTDAEVDQVEPVADPVHAAATKNGGACYQAKFLLA